MPEPVQTLVRMPGGALARWNGERWDTGNDEDRRLLTEQTRATRGPSEPSPEIAAAQALGAEILATSPPDDANEAPTSDVVAY